METPTLLHHFRRIECQLQGHPNKLLTSSSAITTLYIFIQLHNQVVTRGFVLGTHCIHTPSKEHKSCRRRALSDLNTRLRNFALSFLKPCQFVTLLIQMPLTDSILVILSKCIRTFKHKKIITYIHINAVLKHYLVISKEKTIFFTGICLPWPPQGFFIWILHCRQKNVSVRKERKELAL